MSLLRSIWLLSVVLFQLAAGVIVGADTYLRVGATTELDVTQLDTDSILVCYFSKGVQYTRFCRVVWATGSVLTAQTAAALTAAQTPPAAATVVALDASSAVACDCFQFVSFTCRLLTISGAGAITAGAGTVVYAGAVAHPASAALSGASLVVCYATANGVCSFLGVSAGAVAVSATVTANVGATARIAVAGFGSTDAVACFQDTAASSVGRCAVLHYDGSAWQVGSEFTFHSSTTNSVALTKLDIAKVLLCYETTGSGVCKVLVISGTTISQPGGNPDTYIMTTAQGVTLANMNRVYADPPLLPSAVGSAAVCHRRAATAKGACHHLDADDGLTQVVRGDEIVISSGDITQVALARLTASAVAACYLDLADAESAKCKVLDFTITTTTTTSRTTTTSSTATSSTTSATTTTSSTTTTTVTTTLLAHIPTVSVRNLDFVDEDVGADVYGGTLTWDPPLGVVHSGPPSATMVDSYAVYFAPGPTNWVVTRELAFGEDLGVGNLSAVIPLGTSLLTKPFILVYTSNPDGRQDTPASVLVRDVVEPWAIMTSLSFFDEDIDRFEIKGTFAWAAPAGGLPYVTKLHVYFATAPALENATLQQVLGPSDTSFSVDDGSGGPLGLDPWTHFAVFAANDDLEAPVGAWLEIVDRGVPVAGVSAMDFTDLDLQADFIEGTLSWTPPADESDVTVYRAYMSVDALTQGASVQLGGDVAAGAASSVAVGPSQALGLYAYFVVWAFNAVGQQRVPTSLPIADRGISFEDTDVRRGVVAGAVAWSSASGSVGQLRIYLADGPTAAAERIEVALNMQSVEFTSSYHLPPLLASLQWSGDEWRLSADLVRATPAGAATVLAAAGARLLLRGGYSGQPLSDLAVPFTLVFGTDFDHTAAEFELPAVNMYDGWPTAAAAAAGRRLAAATRYLHVSPETAGGASLGLRVGLLEDRGAPEAPVLAARFSDQDVEGRHLGGPVRWSQPSPEQFALLDSGWCDQPIQDTAACASAAVHLGLEDTAVLDDNQVASDVDPPWCYFEASKLKFNNGTNTATCSPGRRCLCDILDHAAPATSRYAVWLSDVPDMHTAGGGQSLLQEVDGNTTEVVLPMGTRAYKWALILVGNADGFNDWAPTAVPLVDLQVYRSWRTSAKAAVCDAR